MCPYARLNACVRVCMSAKSVCTRAKHPERDRALSVFVCHCVNVFM